jgi:hypothetical protein
MEIWQEIFCKKHAGKSEKNVKPDTQQNLLDSAEGRT